MFEAPVKYKDINISNYGITLFNYYLTTLFI